MIGPEWFADLMLQALIGIVEMIAGEISSARKVEAPPAIEQRADQWWGWEAQEP